MGLSSVFAVSHFLQVDRVFSNNAIDVVMHFAAVAYVGESMAEPLRYYHNVTANTLTLVEAMARHGVNRLIYSSTCATYGEPKKMPITEDTPQVRSGTVSMVCDWWWDEARVIRSPLVERGEARLSFLPQRRSE